MLRTEKGSWGTDEETLHFQYLRHDNNEERPVLVFLHDALGSIPQWKNFPEQVAMASGLDALIYERRGHGRSSPLAEKRGLDYLHRQAFYTLPRLLRSLDIKRPLLIGHSDGGTIALLYASRHKAEMLIAIAAHVLLEEITLRGVEQARLYKREKMIAKLQKYHGEKTEALFDAWADTWLDSDFSNWNIIEDIKSITCPVLAIQGTADQYGSEKQMQTILNALGKRGSALWIEKGGHFPHLRQMDLLTKVINNFILSRLSL